VVACEALFAAAILIIVPLRRGSARTEAGWHAASPFDVEALGIGLLLVVLLAAALWVGTRIPCAGS
jgi:hypothetical protein